MQFSSDIEIVELEFFDAALLVTPGTESRVKQRFMTLFVESNAREIAGGSAHIRKARNVLGEVFALKTMRGSSTISSSGRREKVLKSPITSPQPDKNVTGPASQNLPSPVPDYITKGRTSAFYEEYRMHLAVSQLRGFPKLYGFGLAGGVPLIVMEWIEGITLHDLVRGTNHKPGAMLLELIAAIGSSVLGQLELAHSLQSGFVHRDISPRNIMFRIDKTPVEEQLESGQLDLCLVDFGSAVFFEDDTSLTADAGIWRKGTPAYAPPEMLTSDVELPQGYRSSETIDSYALCSVLYELYAGQTPFGTHAELGESPYRVKIENDPDPLTPRDPDGGALAETLMAGLAVQQEARPNITQLKDALDGWLLDPAARHSELLLEASETARARQKHPGKRSGKTVTRRRVIAGGILAAAALLSAGIVGPKLFGGTQRIDESRYTRAEQLYSGEPLFKALDAGSASWMLCTADGRIACQPQSSRECGALREGMASLYDDISQLYGFITPASTKDGYAWCILPAFADAGDFSEGLAAAQDPASKLWGFVRADGQWAIRPQFGDACAFSSGVAAVRAVDASGLWGAVDTQGAWAIEPQFEALGALSAEGFAVAKEAAGSGVSGSAGARAWGIVDSSGSWASKARFAKMRRFALGLAPAFDDKAQAWGFVRSDGSWSSEPQFMDARPFSSGLAAVQDAKTQLWYFIEPGGGAHEGMKPRFWKLGELVDGLAPAQASSKDDVVVFDEDDKEARVENVGMRYGYADEQGKWQMKRLTTLVNTAIGPAAL